MTENMGDPLKSPGRSDPDALLRRIEEMAAELDSPALKADIFRGRDRLNFVLEEDANSGVNAAKNLKTLAALLRGLRYAALQQRATLQDALAPEGKGAFDQRRDLKVFLDTFQPLDFPKLVEGLRAFARLHKLNMVVAASSRDRAPVEIVPTALFQSSEARYAVVIQNGNLQFFESVEGDWVLVVDTVTIKALGERLLALSPTDNRTLVAGLKLIAEETGYLFTPPPPKGQIEILRRELPPDGAFTFSVGSGNYALVLKGNKLELLLKGTESWSPVHDQ